MRIAAHLEMKSILRKALDIRSRDVQSLLRDLGQMPVVELRLEKRGCGRRREIHEGEAAVALVFLIPRNMEEVEEAQETKLFKFQLELIQEVVPWESAQHQGRRSR